MINKILVSLIFGFLTVNHVCQAQSQTKNYTSISTDGGCRLYIGDIKFTKTEISGSTQTPTTVFVDGSNLVLNSTDDSYNDTSGNFSGTNDTNFTDAWCGNYNGTLILPYAAINYASDKGIALDNFTLTFVIEYKPQFGWWDVESLTLDATGPMITGEPLNVNWTGALMQSVGIGASKYFNYACSKPLKMYYSTNKETGPIYTLEFMNFQLQPFTFTSKSGDGFSDNVDDCVAFFSAGVWMALCTLLIFVLVIISGVVMLSNMSTVNRFDDPKAKQLVIIPKD